MSGKSPQPPPSRPKSAPSPPITGSAGQRSVRSSSSAGRTPKPPQGSRPSSRGSTTPSPPPGASSSVGSAGASAQDTARKRQEWEAKKKRLRENDDASSIRTTSSVANVVKDLGSEKTYTALLRRAMNMNFTREDKSGILSVPGHDYKNRSVVVFNEIMISKHDLVLQNVILYMMKELDSVATAPFVVVFVCYDYKLPSTDTMKDIFHSFSAKYKRNVHCIHMLYTPTRLRTQLMLVGNIVAGKLTKKLKYLDGLADLHAHVPLDRIAFPDNVYYQAMRSRTNTIITLKQRQLIKFYKTIYASVSRTRETIVDMMSSVDAENDQLRRDCKGLADSTQTPEHFLDLLKDEIEFREEELDPEEETVLDLRNLVTLFRHVGRAKHCEEAAESAKKLVDSGAVNLSSLRSNVVRLRSSRNSITGVMFDGDNGEGITSQIPEEQLFATGGANMDNILDDDIPDEAADEAPQSIIHSDSDLTAERLNMEEEEREREEEARRRREELDRRRKELEEQERERLALLEHEAQKAAAEEERKRIEEEKRKLAEEQKRLEAEAERKRRIAEQIQRAKEEREHRERVEKLAEAARKEKIVMGLAANIRARHEAERKEDDAFCHKQRIREKKRIDLMKRESELASMSAATISITDRRNLEKIRAQVHEMNYADELDLEHIIQRLEVFVSETNLLVDKHGGRNSKGGALLEAEAEQVRRLLRSKHQEMRSVRDRLQVYTERVDEERAEALRAVVQQEEVISSAENPTPLEEEALKRSRAVRMEIEKAGVRDLTNERHHLVTMARSRSENADRYPEDSPEKRAAQKAADGYEKLVEACERRLREKEAETAHSLNDARDMRKKEMEVISKRLNTLQQRGDLTLKEKREVHDLRQRYMVLLNDEEDDLEQDIMDMHAQRNRLSKDILNLEGPTSEGGVSALDEMNKLHAEIVRREAERDEVKKKIHSLEALEESDIAKSIGKAKKTAATIEEKTAEGVRTKTERSCLNDSYHEQLAMGQAAIKNKKHGMQRVMKRIQEVKQHAEEIGGVETEDGRAELAEVTKLEEEYRHMEEELKQHICDHDQAEADIQAKIKERLGVVDRCISELESVPNLNSKQRGQLSELQAERDELIVFDEQLELQGLQRLRRDIERKQQAADVLGNTPAGQDLQRQVYELKQQSVAIEKGLENRRKEMESRAGKMQRRLSQANFRSVDSPARAELTALRASIRAMDESILRDLQIQAESLEKEYADAMSEADRIGGEQSKDGRIALARAEAIRERLQEARGNLSRKKEEMAEKAQEVVDEQKDRLQQLSSRAHTLESKSELTDVEWVELQELRAEKTSIDASLEASEAQEKYKAMLDEEEKLRTQFRARNLDVDGCVEFWQILKKLHRHGQQTLRRVEGELDDSIEELLFAEANRADHSIVQAKRREVANLENQRKSIEEDIMAREEVLLEVEIYVKEKHMIDMTANSLDDEESNGELSSGAAVEKEMTEQLDEASDNTSNRYAPTHSIELQKRKLERSGSIEILQSEVIVGESPDIQQPLHDKGSSATKPLKEKQPIQRRGSTEVLVLDTISESPLIEKSVHEKPMSHSAEKSNQNLSRRGSQEVLPLDIVIANSATVEEATLLKPSSKKIMAEHSSSQMKRRSSLEVMEVSLKEEQGAIPERADSLDGVDILAMSYSNQLEVLKKKLNDVIESNEKEEDEVKVLENEADSLALELMDVMCEYETTAQKLLADVKTNSAFNSEIMMMTDELIELTNETAQMEVDTAAKKEECDDMYRVYEIPKEAQNHSRIVEAEKLKAQVMCGWRAEALGDSQVRKSLDVDRKWEDAAAMVERLVRLGQNDSVDASKNSNEDDRRKSVDKVNHRGESAELMEMQAQAWRKRKEELQAMVARGKKGGRGDESFIDIGYEETDSINNSLNELGISAERSPTLNEELLAQSKSLTTTKDPSIDMEALTKVLREQASVWVEIKLGHCEQEMHLLFHVGCELDDLIVTIQSIAAGAAKTGDVATKIAEMEDLLEDLEDDKDEAESKAAGQKELMGHSRGIAQKLSAETMRVDSLIESMQQHIKALQTYNDSMNKLVLSVAGL